MIWYQYTMKCWHEQMSVCLRSGWLKFCAARKLVLWQMSSFAVFRFLAAVRMRENMTKFVHCNFANFAENESRNLKILSLLLNPIIDCGLVDRPHENLSIIIICKQIQSKRAKSSVQRNCAHEAEKLGNNVHNWMNYLGHIHCQDLCIGWTDKWIQGKDI